MGIYDCLVCFTSRITVDNDAFDENLLLHHIIMCRERKGVLRSCLPTLFQ